MSCCMNFIGIFCTVSSPVQTVFGFSTLVDGEIVMRYYDSITKLPYIGDVESSCQDSQSNRIENYITILEKNNPTDFQHAHASIVVGDRLILGLRSTSNPPLFQSKLISYNVNDLTDFVVYNLPAIHNHGIESICYDEVTEVVFCPLIGTKKMLYAKADDILDNGIQTVALPGADIFGGSSPIITDNTHLYVASELSGKFHKILIFNLTYVSTTNWVLNPQGSHAGGINKAKTKGYFSSNGSGHFAVLDLATMSYIEMQLSLKGITDDLAVIEGFPLNEPYVVVISEMDTPNYGYGASIVDIENMREIPLPLMKSFCVKFDEVNGLLLSASMEGFIEVISVSALVDYVTAGNSGLNFNTRLKTDVYPLRGYTPNEIACLPNNEYLVTSWNGSSPKNSLLKIKLNKVENTVITKIEADTFYSKKVKVITITEDYTVNLDVIGNTLIIDESVSNLLIFLPTTTIDSTIPIGSRFSILILGFSLIQLLVPSGSWISSFSSNSYATANKRITVEKISDNTWWYSE